MIISLSNSSSTSNISNTDIHFLPFHPLIHQHIHQPFQTLKTWGRQLVKKTEKWSQGTFHTTHYLASYRVREISMCPPAYYFVHLSKRASTNEWGAYSVMHRLSQKFCHKQMQTKRINSWVRKVCCITRFIKYYIDASFTVYLYIQTILR